MIKKVSNIFKECLRYFKNNIHLNFHILKKHLIYIFMNLINFNKIFKIWMFWGYLNYFKFCFHAGILNPDNLLKFF